MTIGMGTTMMMYRMTPTMKISLLMKMPKLRARVVTMIVVIATIVHLDSGNGRGAKELVPGKKNRSHGSPRREAPPTWAKERVNYAAFDVNSDIDMEEEDDDGDNDDSLARLVLKEASTKSVMAFVSIVTGCCRKTVRSEFTGKFLFHFPYFSKPG